MKFVSLPMRFHKIDLLIYLSFDLWTKSNEPELEAGTRKSYRIILKSSKIVKIRLSSEIMCRKSQTRVCQIPFTRIHIDDDASALHQFIHALMRLDLKPWIAWAIAESIRNLIKLEKRGRAKKNRIGLWPNRWNSNVRESWDEKTLIHRHLLTN